MFFPTSLSTGSTRFAIELRALMRVLMLEPAYHPLSAPANATGHQCTDSVSSSGTGLIAITIMSFDTTGDDNVTCPSEITATRSECLIGALSKVWMRQISR
jgi:hypothetical protein